jgi:hypothetical protein
MRRTINPKGRHTMDPNTNPEPTATSTLSYGRWSTDANHLPPKAVAYLLANGFTQSMTDAAAFTKEQKANAHEAFAKAHGVEVASLSEADKESAVAALADEKREARFQAILKGEVGTRVGGPRLPQIDRVMREVAEETVRAIATARNVAMPKGDVLKAAIEKVLARNPDEIRAKAQERIDSAKALAEGADDLFAA